MGAKAEDNTLYYFAGIDGARFKRPVEPGDQLMIEVTILGSKRGIWKFGCTARVAETLVAEADILCTVRPAGTAAQ
jgi:3-hydroxyacyl-[acyl-carrier-protein] dehydratase